MTDELDELAEGAWALGHKGEPIPPPSARRRPPVSRNAPCPCGSGRKYKRCCLGKPPSRTQAWKIAALLASVAVIAVFVWLILST